MLKRLWEWWRQGGRSTAAPRTALPFDLFLTTAAGSTPLFPAGRVDPLAFFQRQGVSRHHRVEYLSRLAPSQRGTEEYEPFGLFRLRGSEALTFVRPAQIRRAWAELSRMHGIRRVPEASFLLPGGVPREGLNRLRGPRLAKATVRGGQRVGYDQVLDAMRALLDVREAIAWIEESLQDPPPEGEIAHRYYVGSGGRAFLVRHHWDEGKLLFEAHTSPEAIEVCLSSGHYRRQRAA